MTLTVQEPFLSSARAAGPELSANEGIASVIRRAKRARSAGDLPRAYALYSRATELEPNSAEAWTGRASTTSNLDDAILAWANAAAYSPSREANSMLAACVGEKLKQSAEDVRSMVRLGRKLAQAGQRLPAHRLLMRATELDEKNGQAWVWRAGVAYSDAESEECLRRALMLDPTNVRARAGLKWVRSKLAAASPSPQESEEAERIVEEGQGALQAGDRGRAYRSFARATEIDPKNDKAWFWRGSAAPDLDEAIRCMDQVLAIDPGNEEARDARWWLRVQMLRRHAARRPRSEQNPATETPAATGPARLALPSWPFWIASGFVLVLIGVFALLIAMLLTGYLT